MYKIDIKSQKSLIAAFCTLSQIVEKCNEHNMELQILFVDCKQAFHSLKRDKMLTDAKNLEIPPEITKLIQMTLLGSRVAGMKKEAISNETEIERDARQVS